MKYFIDCKSNELSQFISLIAISLIDQLKLNKCKKPLCIFINKEVELPFCTEVNGEIFIGLPKPPKLSEKAVLELGVSFTHEMVHAKQHAKGQLRIEDKRFVWKGKIFKKDFEYLYRPWEIEAFSKQELFFRRAFDSISPEK